MMEYINDLGKRKVEISIIIPTFNKYPQNLLTLYSLESQVFDLSKVEVIMIDDGSTDETGTIEEEHLFPFRFRYYRCKKNIGRPAARNLGIKYARGELLIFLDAEIIVEPDFLAIHYELHRMNSNLVVSGVMTIKSLYSVLHPDFSPFQIEQIKTFFSGMPEYMERLERFKNNPKFTQLINRSDIHSCRFRKLSRITPYEQFYRRVIISNYGFGLEGYKIPWQLFGTGHVSVTKQAIDRVGVFREYDGYGWDDCEMGYRLYKNGAKFISDERLVSYHQEHPVAETNRDQSKQNYYRFQETYLEVDQMIISLTFLPKPKNLHEANLILTEYQMLCREYPDRFLLIKRLFKDMLREIGKRAKDKASFQGLYDPGDYDKEMLQSEMKTVSKLGRFKVFLHSFEELLEL